MIDAIGIIGVIMVVFGYLQLQRGVYTHLSSGYLWLNLIGSLLITASLFVHWNLASFIIEVFWIGITVYGFWKKYAKK